MFFIAYTLGIAVVAVADVLMTRTIGDMSQAAVNLDTNTLFQFLGFLSILMGIQAVFAALTALLLGRFTGKVAYKFRDNFAKHFLRLPFSEFEKKNSGAMLSIYSNDLPAAASYATANSLGMVRDIVTVLASITYMLIINPIYTGIFYAMFPLLIVMQSLISTPIQKARVEMSDRAEDFNAIVNDSLQNISTVVAYSLEDIMEDRYMTAYNKFFAALKRFIISMLRMVLSGMVASMLPIVVITVVAGYSTINGRMTLAEFIVFQFLAVEAATWLMALADRLSSLKITAAGAVKLLKHTDGDAENINAGSSLPSDKHSVAIKFENVSFAYTKTIEEDEDTTAVGASHCAPDSTAVGVPHCAPDSETKIPALNNVSFEILTGEKTAIVGGSGSGKSTVLKILLGLYDPASGKITVSGHDLKELSKTSLRDNFSYVPQDNFMFPVSVGENITHANHNEPEIFSKLESVARDAGVIEFINNHPDGFDAVLSEAAENVSGGQRQRLAIARAFYKDSPVVLFDEATSSLDPVTESAILDSLSSLMEGRTVIMVSHRLRAVQNFERIILLEAGRVVGVGTHDELINNNQVYTALYEAQNTGHNVNNGGGGKTNE